ncbi:NADP-dependent oxidoreductase [Microbacterium sp. LRZ72]|uniref:quinone oxidoreductase family protein n=1 Tax=Microbacterium sp. LRZ72 TaxID=2942481 RepID=UPI0029A20895|nr:NADP-dependent oxidoreductase [Microbacterium sp. LRZ72]MDX2375874.1 NADP-dependent oxidoreductase [Microbacterium sp. LRZ72]
MTQVIQYSEFGDADVLRLQEIPTPAPGPGQILVRIQAAGVNPIDAKMRSGARSGGSLDKPRRVGRDGAGVVAAVAEDVLGFSVGDAVAFRDTGGTYATELVVDAANAVPRPPSVTAAAAAGIGIPAGTAYQALRSLRVGAGDTLLVHAGSGAVGQMAVQYAVLWGATVIATASPRRFDRVRDLGATPVAYGDGLEQRVRDAAPDGVTVALDTAGTDEAIETSLALVADRDRIATIVRGRDAADFGIRAFGGGSANPLADIELAWRAEALPVTVALLAAGAFSIEQGPSFALADAADAHRAVESGADGKIAIVP